MIKRGWHNRTGFVYSDWLSFGSELGQHLGQGTKTEWKLLFFSPSSGHQRHSWDWENRGICGNFYSRGTEIALWNPSDIPPERPGLWVVCRVLPSSGLFWMGRGVGGLCPQRGLLIFGAAFVFGTEAVVRLSSVFMAVVAFQHWISFSTTALWLGRPIQPVVILWIKSSSLARRPILLVRRHGLVRAVHGAGMVARHFGVCCFTLRRLVVVGWFSGKVTLFSRGCCMSVQQWQQVAAGSSWGIVVLWMCNFSTEHDLGL